jgi:hypothetical protein
MRVLDLVDCRANLAQCDGVAIGWSACGMRSPGRKKHELTARAQASYSLGNRGKEAGVRRM